MSDPLSTLDTTRLKRDDIALLLDFDGTLAEIAEAPHEVVVQPATSQTLALLSDALHGALALVTGRSIEDIDALVHPLRLPVAGIHGMVRRDSAGRQHAHDADPRMIEAVAEALRAFAAGRDGLLLETKPAAIALHYRKRPELEALCSAEADRLLAQHEGLYLMRGKMVIEFKTGPHTKADAVAAFMLEPPFLGRVPLFAGDDVTDEDAFAEVARRGGITIKVGWGDTSAAYRATDTGAFLSWLDGLADTLCAVRSHGKGQQTA